MGASVQAADRSRRKRGRDVVGRTGVRLRATVAAMLVVAVALALAAAALVSLVGSAARETVTASVQTRAQEVAVDLRDRGSLPQLGGVDDGVLVQVVSGDRVVAASSALRGAAPLVATRPATGAMETSVVDGAALGEAGERFQAVVLGVAPSSGADRVIAAQSLAVAERTEGLIARLAAIGVPVLLGVVGAATWFSLGRALRPVEAIRARTARIGAEDLSARVPVPATRDEIAALARTMNEMLDRLEASARSQRAFVSDAGHELRSPVAVIRTEMEVAQHVGAGATTFGDVLGEVARLERLVEDLLVLARADERQFRPHRGDVDVDDLLEIERARLHSGGVAVTTAIRPVRVVGDRAALARVVRNLVDNAVRHASGVVHLGCGREGSNAWIEVADDGPGVPPADRERVFERFVRLDEARARSDGGSGLGLAIVRELVLAAGGEVRLLDGDRLPGARVRVRLPVEGPGQPAAPPSATNS